jgi:hypothetical protein
MALSPNYGWAEPDNSSLVKNGAQDIRALGDAIDTSVWNVGYGQAGKNKIINGDFRVNQRSFTSTTSSTAFTYDRFQTRATDGTTTFTANTFTAGSGPVTSIPALNYLTIQTTGQTLVSARSAILQKIEDVRTLSDQTATISFYAKASAGSPSVAANFAQIFGSGGSSTVDVAGQKAAITTSWAKYSFTFTIPSVTGKTIGSNSGLWAFIWTSAGSDFNTQTASLGIQTATIDIWGVQVEYGSYATPFQTASGGSIQGELAMCQRYYYRTSAETGNQYATFGSGYMTSTTNFQSILQYPVTMRVSPTAIDYANIIAYNFGFTSYAISSVSFGGNRINNTQALLNFAVTGATAGQVGLFSSDNSTTGYFGLSAEL